MRITNRLLPVGLSKAGFNCVITPLDKIGKKTLVKNLRYERNAAPKLKDRVTEGWTRSPERKELDETPSRWGEGDVMRLPEKLIHEMSKEHLEELGQIGKKPLSLFPNRENNPGKAAHHTLTKAAQR